MTDSPKGPTGDMKHDDGKSRVDLIDPQFTINLGHVMAYGAKKYAEESWKTDVANPIPRYLAAAMRHILAFANGQLTDEESGLPALSHAACSLMMLQYHAAREQAAATQLMNDLREVLARHAMSGEIHIILGDNTDTDEGETDEGETDEGETDEGETDVQAKNYRFVGDSRPRAAHVAGGPEHDAKRSNCRECPIQPWCPHGNAGRNRAGRS